MTLLSSVAGAASVALLVPTTEALLRRARLPQASALAVVAALVFGLSRTFWSQALLAEVYTLNALLLLLLLWGLWHPGLSARRIVGLSLLLGLAIGHHRLMLLWLPGLLAWVWLEGRQRDNWRRLPLLAILGGLLLPQLLYLYVPWRGPQTAYLQQLLSPTQMLTLYDGTARAFVEHLSGTVFASNLLAVPLAERLRGLVALGWANVGWLSLLALPALLRGTLPLSDRLLLGSGGVLTGLFALVYGIGDVEVMAIPLWLAVVLLGMVGIAQGVARMRSQVARHTLLALLIVLLLAGRLAHRPPTRANWETPRRLVTDILAAAPPPSAILVSNDRDEMMAFWYAQFAEGQRPDLLAIFPLITQRPEHRTVSEVVGWALRWGRPVFLSKPMPGLALLYNLEPYAGPLVAVRGPAEPPTEPPLQTELAPELDVVGWAPPTSLQAGQTVTVTVALQANAPLPDGLAFSLQLFGEDGTRAGQVDVGADPFFPSGQWPLGEPLRLELLLPIPSEIAGGVYEWRLSTYQWAGEVVPVGQQITLGHSLLEGAP